MKQLHGVRVLHSYSCPIHQLFVLFDLFFAMDFFHSYIQRKTKNHMSFQVEVNTKNLCTFFNFGEGSG